MMMLMTTRTIMASTNVLLRQPTGVAAAFTRSVPVAMSMRMMAFSNEAKGAPAVPNPTTADPALEAEYETEIRSILQTEKEQLARRGALEGEVVSTRCSKTISVMVHHTAYISKYQKHVRRRKKIMAHDESQEAKLGDFVRIVPSRPYSARKRHILKDIVRRARIVDFSDINASARAQKQADDAVAKTANA